MILERNSRDQIHHQCSQTNLCFYTPELLKISCNNCIKFMREEAQSLHLKI